RFRFCLLAWFSVCLCHPGRLHCLYLLFCTCCFFYNVPATTVISTLSLHDALPICEEFEHLACNARDRGAAGDGRQRCGTPVSGRSEEHTSELQSRFDLVCRLLLEKKKQDSKT